MGKSSEKGFAVIIVPTQQMRFTTYGRGGYSLTMTQYQTDTQVSSDTRDKTREPPMFRVILHNDDYTTMEFVVEILMYVFNKSPESAAKIMMDVHKQGIGVCGIYTHDIAETKVETVHSLARENGFPLRCSMEQE